MLFINIKKLYHFCVISVHPELKKGKKIKYSIQKKRMTYLQIEKARLVMSLYNT